MEYFVISNTFTHSMYYAFSKISKVDTNIKTPLNNNQDNISEYKCL